MQQLTAGSLFSGYGGLALAVEEVFGARTAWVADNEAAPSAVLARRFPDAPNLGDITAVDWATVPQVDIIEGGSPCQDVSQAGRRAGMSEGTRSNLWVVMRTAIATIRPRYVIWENVNGVKSARADSAMESDTGLLGDHDPSKPVLRALGRVLGDLAGLGYDTGWATVRASDVGACHQRARVFVLAADRHGERGREGMGGGAGVEGAEVPVAHHRGAAGGVGGLRLLPTPAASNPNDGEPVELWLARRERVKAELRNGNGMGMPLSIALKLLPTLGANLGTNGGVQHPDKRRAGGHTVSVADVVAHLDGNWGEYAEAIVRHEASIGRPPPAPTVTGPRGGVRVSGEFTEWMMGLPHGWLWDLVQDGTITNNEAVKLAGNGVLPAQAAHALRLIVSREGLA